MKRWIMKQFNMLNFYRLCLVAGKCLLLLAFIGLMQNGM